MHAIIPFPFQYENQTRLLLGNWSTKSHWSDASGKLKQPREAFDPPPPGWDWDSDWEIKPEQSIDFEPEQGRNEWTEEIFENQSRQPLSYWPDETSSFWTDAVIIIYRNFAIMKLCVYIPVYNQFSNR